MGMIGDRYEEDVNGIVIGDITRPYEFWKKEKIACEIINVRITRGHFGCATEAIEWFKENFPGDFKNGVEMRAFGV